MAHHSCSICFDTSSDFTTNCTHHFCNECITNWLLINNNCPICRKEFYHISEEEREAIESEEEEDYDYLEDDLDRVIYYIGNIGSYNRDYIEEMYFKWFMLQRYMPLACANNMMKQKLPKNINMHYRYPLYLSKI